jgi:hypothetical protein
VLKDFLNYPPEVASRLVEHDACIWALGRSSAGQTEEAYTEFTVGYIKVFIDALQQNGVTSRPENNPFRFVFVSGEGADPEGKSLLMFARIKVILPVHLDASFLCSHYRAGPRSISWIYRPRPVSGHQLFDRAGSTRLRKMSISALQPPAAFTLSLHQSSRGYHHPSTRRLKPLGGLQLKWPRGDGQTSNCSGMSGSGS